MKITSIIENTTNRGLHVEHGLSLYIEFRLASEHQQERESRPAPENLQEQKMVQKVLFDMGLSGMFVRNAETLGLSIADVDIAVISHGHYDHGGGLKTFLLENDKADVFIHKDAFQPHYSLRDTGLRFIGLDKDWAKFDRLVFCDRHTVINNAMTLFADVTVPPTSKDALPANNSCYPLGNRLLFGPTESENDDFRHEQNLLIEEGEKLVLFAGCAHRGIVNILRKAEEVAGKAPTHVFAGMHLVKSGLTSTEEETFIASLASELLKYKDTMFYTMHCTGEEQYKTLKTFMGSKIEYLACGDNVIIP